MCVVDIWWGQVTLKKEQWEADSLQSHTTLNNFDFVEEITHSCRIALCPWRLHLTAFVLLCLCICHTPNPTPHSLQLIWCPAHQTPFTTNKRGPWQETSKIHTTSSLQSHSLRYQNRPWPRRFLRLIKLYLTHVSMVDFWLGQKMLEFKIHTYWQWVFCVSYYGSK